jgi:hypothetical protein
LVETTRRTNKMAMLSKLKVGQVLHDYHNYIQGNTTLRKEGHWTLVVKEIDLDRGMALCSWNGNMPRWYSEEGLKRFRVKEKVTDK